MNRISWSKLPAALVWGGLILATAPVLAWADTITLKGEVYVTGPKVLLGDVADIEGESKEVLEAVELASAALPGDCRRLDAALVMSRVKNAGVAFEELDMKGARTVRATTLHQDVTAEAIAEGLRAFVEGAMPWDPFETEVDVTMPSQGVVVPDGDLEILWRPNPQYRYVGTGAFRGQVAVDGQVKKTITCRATVEPYVDVVVARYDIPRAKPLVKSGLITEKRQLSGLDAGAFLEIEALEGFVAKRTIFPGQVITNRNVAPRKVIRRNQIVNVETRVAGLVLLTRARARTDACAGEVVICTNLDSKEDFEGIARKDGVVVVP